MENFSLQVMLSDGSFADYEVQTEREAKTFELFQKGKLLASFDATADGGWKITDNPGKINEDLQQRIATQLNGLRV